jgi:hypothetical protein
VDALYAGQRHVSSDCLREYSPENARHAARLANGSPLSDAYNSLTSRTSSPHVRIATHSERRFYRVREGTDGAHLDSGNRDTYGHLVPGANVPFGNRLDAVPVKPDAFLQHLTHFRALNFAGSHLI